VPAREPLPIARQPPFHHYAADVGASKKALPPGYFFVAGVPNQTQSRPHAFELTCLAAAQAAGEAASELVRVTREGTPVPVEDVLARLVDATRVVAELESRPQDAELLVAIHRWSAEHADTDGRGG
jgi:hypothetical protein